MREAALGTPVAALPRLLALAIDAAWVTGLALPLWAQVDGAGPAMFALIAVGLSLAAVPCWLGLGGTPGQLLLGQRLVDDRGEERPLSLVQVLLRWALAWITLASLMYAPLWRVGGRQRPRAWHDRASGTEVVVRDPEAEGSTLARHWAGELPLAESLWLYALGLPLVLLLVLLAIQAAMPFSAVLLRSGALLLMPGALLLVAMLAWGVAGAWRAAARPPRRARQPRSGPPPAWPRHGARLLALAGALAMASALAVNLLPRAADMLALLIGHDRGGRAVVTVSPDGRRLLIKGPLGLGSATAVAQALQAAPGLQMVVLDAAGGRLPEALAVAERVRARGLHTRVAGPCIGPCAFVLLAGSRRQLLPGARLGLHRESAGAFNPVYQAAANRALGQRLLAAGLSPHGVTKTLASPPARPWFPEADEWAAAGLVTPPERPLDVDLPGPQGATAADYAEALAASALWQTLERRFPGMQALAAEHMAAASPQGADAVQAAGHEVVAALLPPLLAQASPETRWLFTELLLAQMNALAADPGLCRRLLLGDAAAHRRLPRELAWREAEWLLGALGETPRAVPPRRPNALELEVIRRTLGLRAPQHLALLWRPVVTPPDGEPDCERGRAMLAELSTLAAPQRRLALRLMFERE